MAIHSLLENKATEISEDSPLIGSESLLDSMKLVELCLALEDKATELGFGSSGNVCRKSWL